MRTSLTEAPSRAARTDRIDPNRWRSLIMSFQRFYGLADDQAGPSRLAETPEELYRS